MRPLLSEGQSESLIVLVMCEVEMENSWIPLVVTIIVALIGNSPHLFIYLRNKRREKYDTLKIITNGTEDIVTLYRTLSKELREKVRELEKRVSELEASLKEKDGLLTRLRYAYDKLATAAMRLFSQLKAHEIDPVVSVDEMINKFKE